LPILQVFEAKSFVTVFGQVLGSQEVDGFASERWVTRRLA
jgi:hypothetical protein